MTPRARIVAVLLVLAGLVLAAALAVRLGWARVLFHETYERLAGVEVLGPDAERDPPLDSPYLRWLERARAEIPVAEVAAIDNVATAALRPWPQKGEGVRGLYLRLEDDHVTDARLLEIPAGGSTAAERHLYEKGVYFLGGPGHTVFETPGAAARRVDWREGSLLSIPLNTRYRHFNDGAAPVRLLAVTSFPFVLNSFGNLDFVQRNEFVFSDRYDGGADYFERELYTADDWLDTHFVEDIRDSEVSAMAIRGAGNRVMHWNMAGNQMLSLHVSEIPPGSYKRAHRHSNSSPFLLLSGEGYTLAWPARGEHQRRRVDWQAGTFFAPPPYWYHQHFNPGSAPARYLSINTPDLLQHLGLRFTDQVETRQPELQREFERAVGEAADGGR